MKTMKVKNQIDLANALIEELQKAEETGDVKRGNKAVEDLVRERHALVESIRDIVTEINMEVANYDTFTGRLSEKCLAEA